MAVNDWEEVPVSDWEEVPVASSGPPTVEESPVPKWGQENPNLYGAYGAGRALLRAGVEGVGTGLGAAGGAAVGGPLGGVGGAGLGYATGKRLADFALGKEDGQAPDSVGQFGKDALVGALFQAPGAAIASRPLRTALSALPAKLPRALYESAMKFSNNPSVLSPVERRAAIETGLIGDYRPNESSYERLWSTVNTNKGKVNKIVDAGETAGDAVDTSQVLRFLEPLEKRAASIVSPNPVKNQHGGMHSSSLDLSQFQNSLHDIKTQIESYGPTIPVKTAQNLKETLQDLSTFTTDDRSKYVNRAYKSVGRGLRIELERLYPELAKLNKESSSLLTLENELAKAVGRVGNRDVTSLGLRVALSGQPSPVGVTNAVMSIFEMPRIKARLATALYKAQTGKSIPVSQWRKVAGQVFSGRNVATIKGASDQAKNDKGMTPIESAMLTTDNDPLGIR